MRILGLDIFPFCLDWGLAGHLYPRALLRSSFFRQGRVLLAGDFLFWFPFGHSPLTPSFPVIILVHRPGSNQLPPFVTLSFYPIRLPNLSRKMLDLLFRSDLALRGHFVTGSSFFLYFFLSRLNASPAPVLRKTPSLGGWSVKSEAER